MGLRYEIVAHRLRERPQKVEIHGTAPSDRPGAVAVQVLRPKRQVLRFRDASHEVEVRGEPIEGGFAFRDPLGAGRLQRIQHLFDDADARNLPLLDRQRPDAVDRRP